MIIDKSDCTAVQSDVIDFFKRWVWSYRNDALKEVQQIHGITKKMLRQKFRNRDKTLITPVIRSCLTKYDLEPTCITDSKDIIRDFIRFGSSLKDV